MGSYIIRRLFSVIPITLGVIFITFVLFRVIGGNPAYRLAGKNATAQRIAELSHQRGYNKPWFFGFWAEEYPKLTLENGAEEIKGRRRIAHALASNDKPARLRVRALDASVQRDHQLILRLESGDIGTVRIYHTTGVNAPDKKDLLVEKKLQPGASRFTATLPASAEAKDAGKSVPTTTGVFLVELNGKATLTSAQIRSRQDNPFDAQLWHLIGTLMRLDFGKSEKTEQQVSDMILDGFLPSLSLTVPIFIINLIIALSLSLVTAYYRNTWIDRSIVTITIMAMSISALVYCMVAQYWLAFKWQLFPVWGFDGPAFLLLPVLIGLIAGIGGEIRFYRTVMLDEVNQDYVRTARAKGVGERGMLFRHVLRNALIPILTNVVVAIPFLYTGSLLLENFFGIPGLGRMTVNAINTADEDVIYATTFIGSILFVVANLITDIAYTWADPRIRLK